MDLFYRGYDPDARITSGAEHLSAAAARFSLSIILSIPHLPESAWTELQQMLTVSVLWSLSIVLAGWLIATVVGGLIGLAVNALLIAYGLVELWEQIKATAGELRDWAVAAYSARSEADLDLAAQHFARALATGGITLLEVLVTHRVFRAVEGKLRTRFPSPEWIETKYEQAAQERETGRRAEKARTALEKAADVVTSGVRYEGAKRAADAVPTAAVVVGGAVLTVGAVAVVAWAAAANARRESR